MEFSRVLTQDDRQKPGLGWAFTASSWFHIALIVALLFTPLHRPRDDHEKPIEVDIRTPAPPPQKPKEPIAPLRKAPRPRAEAPPPSAPAQRAPAESPPIAAVPIPPRAPEIREAVPNRLGNSSRETRSEPQRMPPRGSGDGTGAAEGEPPPGPGTGSGTNPRTSLRRALSDFGRDLARGPAGGGGSGNGGSKGKGGGLSVSGLSPSGFGVGNLWFDSRDFDWTPYEMQIYYSILHAWYRRLYAMREQFDKWAFERGDWMIENQNQVRFTILGSGEVSDIAIEAPSGCPPLDTSSVDALREVVLPPLPSDFPRPQETVHVRFLVKGDIHGMRDDPLLQRAYFGD